MAVVLSVLGFVILLRLTDQIVRLASGVAQPAAETAAAPVPGLGRVTEIGQIGEAFTHLLDDLRGSTERLFLLTSSCCW